MTITESRSGVLPVRTEFTFAWRGYDRERVKSYVRAVEEEIRLLTADRDSAADTAERLAVELDAVRGENDALRARLERVSRSPIETDGLSERLLRMVDLAHEEAGEIVENARTIAEQSWAAAHEAAERLRSRYDRMLAELDERRAQMETEHRELMARAQADAEAMTKQAERRRRELDEQAARRRQEAEREFTAAMAGRREETVRLIEERETAAKAKAERLLADATARARESEELRRRIAAELRTARQVLTEAIPFTEPLEGEDEALRAAAPVPASAVQAAEPVPASEPGPPLRPSPTPRPPADLPAQRDGAPAPLIQPVRLQ
ncbi:metallopeptidase [Prauserella flavalba]|uniref:metallopeptidase n=1 Tax=Prauserella flavalba TaxID=1477506 RepID=UPI0036F0B2A3